MAEIDAKVKAIIADKLGVEESQVVNEAEIPDEDTQKIATVGDAIAYVEKKLGK